MNYCSKSTSKVKIILIKPKPIGNIQQCLISVTLVIIILLEVKSGTKELCEISTQLFRGGYNHTFSLALHFQIWRPPKQTLPYPTCLLRLQLYKIGAKVNEKEPGGFLLWYPRLLRHPCLLQQRSRRYSAAAKACQGR